jgi:hypothetical protein
VRAEIAFRLTKRFVCSSSLAGKDGFGPGAASAAWFIAPPTSASFSFAAEARDLVIRAEPADFPAGFLPKALLVQGGEAGEDFVVAEVGSPAIGGGDFGIQIVVVFFQAQHETVAEVAAVVGRQGIGWGAAPELFQHVCRGR